MRYFPVFLIACLAGACEDQSPAGGTMRVGAILALTGPVSFLGQPEALVLNALADRARAAGITLDIRDSGGDAATAQSLFEAMAADPSVVAVIGPSTSGESLVVAARADALELTMMSLAANKGIVKNGAATRPWVFKFAQNDDLAAERLALAMRANGDTAVAQLYSDDAFGTGAAEAFRAAAAVGVPIRIVSDASYPALLANADAVAAQIGANVRAVIIWGTSPGPPLIVKALRARGYTGRIYLSHGNATSAFITDAGAAGEGAFVVGPRLFIPDNSLIVGQPADDAIRAYHALWASVGTGLPSTFGGHARDALEAIISVTDADLRRMSSAARRRALRDRIEKLVAFPGVSGVFTFSPTDHAGLTSAAFQLYRIQGGQFVVVNL